MFYLETVSSFPVFPICASLISSMAGFIVARMESRVGRAIGSQSLIASSKDAFYDMYTSLAVLLGILMAYYKIPYAEGSIIILISLLLIRIGVENVWTALLVLLDANLYQAEEGRSVRQVLCDHSDHKLMLLTGPVHLVEDACISRKSTGNMGVPVVPLSCAAIKK